MVFRRAARLDWHLSKWQTESSMSMGTKVIFTGHNETVRGTFELNSNDGIERRSARRSIAHDRAVRSLA